MEISFYDRATNQPIGPLTNPKWCIEPVAELTMYRGGQKFAAIAELPTKYVTHEYKKTLWQRLFRQPAHTLTRQEFDFERATAYIKGVNKLMTAPNNDELRKQILKEGKVSASVWRVTARMYDDEYIEDYTQTAQQIVEIPIDDLMQLIATHDQQLLEAILEGAEPNPTTPAGENEFVPVEHIKSVFNKEGES